jgi:D-glycero-alpha-D-manno-heptose 1-phosphate guanylyltransferase
LIREAIILAGGLGTRLRDTIPDLPKCMAPVAGRPFLFYVINSLRMQGIERFVFSLGYKHELIEDYLNKQFPTLDFQCTIEAEPLGTGGAIRLACEKTKEKNVLIANGDTLFKINVEELAGIHEQNHAATTLALKPMNDFDRYGVVETGPGNVITSFREKQFYEKGNINGGVYILNVEKFISFTWPPEFSFETDYLEKKEPGIYGIVQDGYFIDIGIPEDYHRAQEDLKLHTLELKKVDKNWTLFLDRDGVINEDKLGSYIFNPDEFVFMKGAMESFKKFNQQFRHIVIVTNQRGVGRGLMTEEALDAIHKKMLDQVKAAGGRIDAIYYCSSIDNTDPKRKPNPGMALQACQELPGIDLSRSMILGNNYSDMQFGRNAGMHTVFISSTCPVPALPHPDIDLTFSSLADFAKAL